MAFHWLYGRYGRSWMPDGDPCRAPIDGRKRLGIFLMWMAHGMSYRCLQNIFGIGLSTIQGIIQEVAAGLRCA